MRAILVAVCGLSLGACTAADLMRFETTPTPVSLRLESDPPGAEVKLSTGATCTTPCTLAVVPAGELTAAYTLKGYEPELIALEVVPPGAPGEPSRISPNPLAVTLEPVAVPAKRPPAVKRAPAKAAPRPAAKAPAAPKPAARPAAPGAAVPAAAAAAAEPAPQAAPWPAPPAQQPAAAAAQPPPWPAPPPASPWPDAPKPAQ